MDEQQTTNAQPAADEPAAPPQPAVVPRRRFLVGSAALLAVVAGAGGAARRAFGGRAATPTPPATLPPVVGTDPRTPTPRVDERANGYVVTAPRTLRSGGVEMVSFALFAGSKPVNSRVAVSLTDKGGKVVAEHSDWVLHGRGGIPLALGAVAAGEYTLAVSGNGFTDKATVRVEDGTILFLETDKPIYKPGETVRIRVVALDVNLRPVATTATVEAQDAKGIKIFKKTVATDAYGMATLDLPLSTEPNLGVWKLRAAVGESVGSSRATQLDVRVERYVLPKYEVKATLPKDWALVNEPIGGTVAAEYTFGQPVKGEVEIVGMVYRGAWQQFGKATMPLNGSAAFQLPAVGYAAGSPGNAGSGGARLDITVREAEIGYEETTSKLLTVVAAPVTLRLIPEGQSFKPGLPLSILVIAESPDKSPVDANVTLTINAQDAGYKSLPRETHQIRTTNGAGLLTFTPNNDAVNLSISSTASVSGVSGTVNGVQLSLRSSYSPSGAFLRIEQTTRGALKVGDTARFAITTTKEARNFYYEVVSRGKVVFSDQTNEREIALTLMPYMAPDARLLVYQILPDSEVAADWLSFKVAGSLPQQVTVSTDQEEVRPGAELDLRVQTEGAARVGLVAVDRAVFILAENRLNLQQVFGEIERLYGTPQAEAHDVQPGGGPVPMPVPGGAAPGGIVAPRQPGPVGLTINPGAKEAFQGAGVLVLTNRTVPAGKSLQQESGIAFAAGVAEPARAAAPASAAASAAAAPQATRAAAGNAAVADQGQAEPERTREFFPETWVWSTLTTDASGRGSQRVTAPDSITTWNFRAVALSQEKGLGIGEAELRVFQPFFVSIDLPYSAIRGEEFPVSLALYNYDSVAQEFAVELDRGDWFTLLDNPTTTVNVEPKSVGAATFTIQPNLLGVRKLKVTARGRTLADAIIKDIIIEPEGVQREQVENAVLAVGTPRTFGVAAPAEAISGSHRALVAVTGSVLAQTIEGLENLLKMPYGCGEQNMLLFAPDVFIARYLKESGQNKPEIMAKAELLMITGYQRELTYRRTDGSFSAFGQSDKVGSLWLTAFVLKTFAQADGLIFIDEQVQAASRAWIGQQQKPDGSFDQVGFVHHQEMMGGVSGKAALTAYIAVALLEAGDTAAANKALGWLEGQLAATTDPYALALTAYALDLAKSARAAAARARLLAIATESDEGLSWGDSPQPIPAATPTPVPGQPIRPGTVPPHRGRSAATETTAYAALALLAGGDSLNAGRALRWISSRRGSQGGFGSTQDTVVALQALTASAATSRNDIDATVILSAGSWRKELALQPANADVMQIVELPEGTASATLEARGKGQPVVQAVSRYNLPAAEVAARSAFQLDVQYSTDQVATNDLITVTAGVRFTPPTPVLAGMVVVDIAVPTGFAPETSSLEALAKRTPKLKRWDVAGRKVLFYIEEMQAGESLGLTFQARALYPVRAQAVASQAYAYYRPEWRGEHLGTKVVVSGRS